MNAINYEQRAALQQCAGSLSELAGFARKIDTNTANDAERRRAAELVSSLPAELNRCAEIIRAAK